MSIVIRLTPPQAADVLDGLRLVLNLYQLDAKYDPSPLLDARIARVQRQIADLTQQMTREAEGRRANRRIAS